MSSSRRRKLSALIIGHSIPKRFNKLVYEHGRSVEQYLGVDHYFHNIKIRGSSGAKFSKPDRIDYLFKSCFEDNYDLIILDLGCNDIASGIKPMRVMINMVGLAEKLVKHGFNVLIMSMLPRVRKPWNFSDHSLFDDIKKYNFLLRNHCQGELRLGYFPQNGFFSKPIEATTIDGIHPHMKPGSPYFKNLRRALFKGLSMFIHKY